MRVTKFDYNQIALDIILLWVNNKLPKIIQIQQKIQELSRKEKLNLINKNIFQNKIVKKVIVRVYMMMTLIFKIVKVMIKVKRSHQKKLHKFNHKIWLSEI